MTNPSPSSMRKNQTPLTGNARLAVASALYALSDHNIDIPSDPYNVALFASAILLAQYLDSISDNLNSIATNIRQND